MEVLILSCLLKEEAVRICRQAFLSAWTTCCSARGAAGAGHKSPIREMAAYTVCPPHAKELQELLAEATYQAEVRAKRITMLDLLERYEACEPPFERFLELLPPLKPRYYSISSSPKVSPNTASITVSVVRGSAWSGQGNTGAWLPTIWNSWRRAQRF